MIDKAKRRVLCVVMDGIGERASPFGNAVLAATTPHLERLRQASLFTTLKAHGTAVGLPSDADIGNSEVGHNALGAGRIFAQGAKLVNAAIASGRIFQGECWQSIVKRLTASKGTLHFLGLLSDGNVHSHESHLYKMLTQAKEDGVRKVRVHVLFDGRDVGEKSAEIYVDHLERHMEALRSPEFDVQVASGGGRMLITMDRYEADWSMVDRGWKTHVLGKASHSFSSLPEALATFRQDPSITDQYIPAFVIKGADAKPVGTVEDGDAVVFFNYRGDRAIEISRAFTEPDFDAFDRERVPDVFYAGMMEYDGDLHIPANYLVEPPEIDNTLSQTLLEHGSYLFACSETQKYGHVTYFWNGNRSGYLDKSHETYVEVPSDEGITFDRKPAMKAKEITDVVLKQLADSGFDFGRINYANGDMVGHTGNFAATVLAVEAVDREIGRLVEAARKTNTILLVTSDHGNADEMFDAKEEDSPGWESGLVKLRPKTAHTLSPVPLYIFDPAPRKWRLTPVKERTLSHVANTVLKMMGLPENELYLPSLVKPQ